MDYSYRHFISNGDFEGWNLASGYKWWLVLATRAQNKVFASAPSITNADRKNNLLFFSVMGYALGNTYKARIFRSAVHPLGREIKRPEYNEIERPLLSRAEEDAMKDAIHILNILDPKAAQALEYMVESSREHHRVFGTKAGHKRLIIESFNIDLFVVGGIGISLGQLVDIESHRRYLFLSVGPGLGLDVGISAREGVVFVPIDQFSGPGTAASGSFMFVEGNVTFAPNGDITSISGGWSIGLDVLLAEFGLAVAGSATAGYTWVVDVDRVFDWLEVVRQGTAIQYVTGRRS